MKHVLRNLAMAATLALSPFACTLGQDVLPDPSNQEGPMTNEQTYRGRGAPPPMPAPRNEAGADLAPAPTTTTKRGIQAPQRPIVQGPAHGRYTPSVSYNSYGRHGRYGYRAHRGNRIWVAGHWRFDFYSYRYIWVRGRWAFPPRAGMVFVAGHWRHAHGGWVWVRSHWRFNGPRWGQAGPRGRFGYRNDRGQHPRNRYGTHRGNPNEHNRGTRGRNSGHSTRRGY